MNKLRDLLPFGAVFVGVAGLGYWPIATLLEQNRRALFTMHQQAEVQNAINADLCNTLRTLEKAVRSVADLRISIVKNP